MAVVALAVGDTADAMRAFMKAGGWSFPVVMAANELAAAYELQYIPTLVLIDAAGEIKTTEVGVMRASEIADAVRDL